MSQIKNHQIRGVFIDNGLVCTECADEAEIDDANLDQLFLDEHIEKDEEDRFFCDRCNAAIR